MNHVKVNLKHKNNFAYKLTEVSAGSSTPVHGNLEAYQAGRHYITYHYLSLSKTDIKPTVSIHIYQTKTQLRGLLYGYKWDKGNKVTLLGQANEGPYME